MIQAYSEQLIAIDELRARMPHLRAREASLRGPIDGLDAQAADWDAYLKLAGNLECFLTQVRGNAATADVTERQRVLRLLVNNVLAGPEKITIRHRIPARAGSTSPDRHDTDTDGTVYLTVFPVLMAEPVVRPERCRDDRNTGRRVQEDQAGADR